MKLIPDTGLFLEVEKLIQLARKSGEPARQQRVPYEHDGSAGELTVEVVPLDSSQSTLVLFEPLQGTAGRETEPPDAPPEGDIRDRQISRLKQQLTDAKKRFLSAIEANQTSREESQNTTEEALSANEELQSLNEELETAKEELQSTNEELITVNDELQSKNAALAQARDFAMSIVETVRQPLLVLDMDLRITMANRAFYGRFKYHLWKPRDRSSIRCRAAVGTFPACGIRWTVFSGAATRSRISKSSRIFQAWGTGA